MTPDSSHRCSRWGKIGFAAAAVIAGMVLMLGVIGGMEWTNRTEFCISCHMAKSDTDSLFFMPDEVRRKK